MPTDSQTDFAVLARVRHALRGLTGAIEQGASRAGLTVQQQAFLLSLAAAGAETVQLATLRTDLGMDQATASELLARLVRRGLVRRQPGRDRRALQLSLTPSGRAALRRSIEGIRVEIRRAHERGDLDALRESLDDYLRFYLLGEAPKRGGRRR